MGGVQPQLTPGTIRSFKEQEGALLWPLAGAWPLDTWISGQWH